MTSSAHVRDYRVVAEAGTALVEHDLIVAELA
jgi:hypothetical protein